jgi:putative toxin-antitoxin system antitoxin component (TIGR02293 family)
MDGSFDLDATVSLLGGAQLLGEGSIRSPGDFDRLIRVGLPVAALEHLAAVLQLPDDAIVIVVGSSPRSGQRRRTQAGRLNQAESKRAFRLARIAAAGCVALGSPAAVGRWLQRRNHALGGKLPISLLRTDVGARDVQSALTRALLGGFS